MNLIESVTNRDVNKLIAEAMQIGSYTTCPGLSELFEKDGMRLRIDEGAIEKYIEKHPDDDYSNVRIKDKAILHRGYSVSVLDAIISNDDKIRLLEAGADPNVEHGVDKDDEYQWARDEKYNQIKQLKTVFEWRIYQASLDDLPVIESMVEHGAMSDIICVAISLNVDGSPLKNKVFKELFKILMFNPNGNDNILVNKGFAVCSAPLIEMLVDIGAKFTKDTNGKHPWEYTGVGTKSSREARTLKFKQDLTYRGLGELAEMVKTKTGKSVEQRNLKHLFERRKNRCR